MVTLNRLSMAGLLLFLSVTSLCHAQKSGILSDSIPQRWQYSSEFSQTLPTDDKWWLYFNDKCLDSLISIAITNNYDVLTAQRRISMAKNAERIAQSGYYPGLSIDAGWNKERLSAVDDDYFTLGLNFNWEIDLFGQISSQAKNKKALWQASKAQYEGTMVSLCANVATAYINLRTWQTQLFVATSHINSQKQILDMTEARYKSGLASKLDVTQARTIYLNTLSSVSPLKASIESQIHSISLLLGVYADALPKSIYFTDYNMTDSAIVIPVGIPADLLRRRPDIRSAEYTLASLAASVGIAKKEFLPTLSLSGNIGFKTDKINNIFSNNSFTYSFTPKISWTIFEGLSRNYQLANAKEQYQIAINNYNNTVMTAITEVQNAMIAYHFNSLETHELIKVNEAALLALQLSVDLYKRGLSDFTNVLTSQQNYLQYNNSLVTSRGKTLLSLIALYQALGGGWDYTY